MHASTVLAFLLAGLSAAAPQYDPPAYDPPAYDPPAYDPPTSDPPADETLDITNFFVRKDSSSSGEVIHAVGFKLSGPDLPELSCNGDNPAPNQVFPCGADSGYSFNLNQTGTPDTSYTVTVFHDVDGARTLGDGTVGVFCHAGGDGPNDFVCTQVAPATVTIKFVPPVHA